MMVGTVEVGRFSAAVLEGLCRILEEEADAIYHRLSPSLRSRLQSYDQEAGIGSGSLSEEEVAERMRSGRGDWSRYFEFLHWGASG
jgi:hypothetical protein